MWKKEFNVGRKLYARSSSAFFNDAIPLTISNSVRKCCFHRFPSMHVLHESTTVSKDNITSGSRFSVRHNSNSLSTIYTQRDKDRDNYLCASNQVEDDFLNKLGKSSSGYIQNIVRRSYATNINSTSREPSRGSLLEKDPKLTKSVGNLLTRQSENILRGNAEQLMKDKIPDVVSHTTKKLPPDTTSHEEVDWLKKVELVMGDLKRMARKVAKKEGKVARKPHERHRIHSLIEEAHWVDKAVAAHKKQLRVAKVSLRGNSPKEINENNFRKQFAYSKDGIPPSTGGSSKFDPPRTSASNISKSTNSETTTIQSSNNVSDTPNIELRMSPSQNESIVSVNVNSFRTADISQGGSNAKEFSVIITTNQKKAQSRTHSLGTITGTPARTVNTSSGNVSSTQNTVQISISEESVPTNQIKFAINGKPLAELKGLQAKADQLDVVTAGDKVEIKVPLIRTSVEDSSSKGSIDSNSVLNLKISTKLDGSEPRQSQYNTPGTVKVTDNKSSQGVTKTSSDVIDSGKSTINYGTGNIYRPRVDNEHGHQSTQALGGNSEIPLNSQSFKSSTQQKEESARIIDNHGPNKEKRIPSNMIPWWSSEDAFSKMKKKEKNNIESNARPSFDVSSTKFVKKKQGDTESTKRRTFLETIKSKGTTQGDSFKSSTTSAKELKGVASNLPNENATRTGKRTIGLTFEILAKRGTKKSGEVRKFGRTGKSDWRISHPVKEKRESTEKISSNSISVTERKLDCDTIQMREQVENRFSANRRVNTESGKRDQELKTTVNTSTSKTDIIKINNSKLPKSENRKYLSIRNLNASRSKSADDSRIDYDVNPSSKILSENERIISRGNSNKTASVAEYKSRAQITQKEYQTEFNEKRMRKTPNKENFASNNYKLTSWLPGSGNKNSSTTDSETGLKANAKQIASKTFSKQSPIIDKKNLKITDVVNKSTEKIGTAELTKPSSTASLTGNKFGKRIDGPQSSSPEHDKTSALKAAINQKIYDKPSISFPNLKNLSKALSNSKIETVEGSFRSRSASATDKRKISSIDMPPLAGTVNPPPRKELKSKKPEKNKEQVTEPNVTGNAPLAGTVVPVAKEKKPTTDKTGNPKRNT